MIQSAITALPANGLAFNVSPACQNLIHGSSIAHYAAAIVSRLRAAGVKPASLDTLALAIRRETGLDWAIITQALPLVEQNFEKD